MSLGDHEAAQKSGTFPGGGEPDKSHTLGEVGKELTEETEGGEEPVEGEGDEGGEGGEEQ